MLDCFERQSSKLDSTQTKKSRAVPGFFIHFGRLTVP